MPLDNIEPTEATAAAATEIITHKIFCKEIDYTKTGPVYRVTYEGEVIIPRAWDPLTEAARILIARGCNPNDRIELRGREPYARLRGRLGFAAGMTVAENSSEGPRWTKYKPHPGFKSQDGVSRSDASVPAAGNVSEASEGGK